MPHSAWKTRLVSNVATLVILGIVFVEAAVLAFGLEPHWSSRDGRHFIARASKFDRNTRPAWVEVRGRVDAGSIVIASRRRRHGHLDGTYRLAQTGDGPRRTTVALLHGQQDVLLRLPRRSRTLAVLTAPPETDDDSSPTS